MKRDLVDQKLQALGGLYVYLLQRDQSDPRPSLDQLAAEVSTLSGVEVYRDLCRLWLNKAYAQAEVAG